LASSSYEALFGGAAGGGKSDALLMGALACVEQPRYTAILFRRTFPELEKKLIPRSLELFRLAYPGARYNEEKRFWRFPSGAKIYFGHLEHEKDVYQHQSAEYQYIAFDELTSFTEKQYVYLLSRARSSTGVPIQIRAATNPGGEGHEWVFRRWAPWLDRDCPARAGPGRARWYLTESDGTDRWVSKGTPGALSRVFIPARLADNPTLVENDPDYATRLEGLDPVTRAQLRDGDWLIKPVSGQVFSRSWFEIVDAAPADVASRIRCWDRAATRPHEGNKDPDWTRGVRLSRTTDGLYFVEHMESVRDRPYAVDQLILTMARADPQYTAIGVFRDPGSAGVAEAEAIVKTLSGFDVRVLQQTGDKLTRARPVSAQAEARNIKLVRGAWNEAFLRELDLFPSGAHDDIVDALSGGFSAILNRTPAEQFRILSVW